MPLPINMFVFPPPCKTGHKCTNPSPQSRKKERRVKKDPQHLKQERINWKPEMDRWKPPCPTGERWRGQCRTHWGQSSSDSQVCFLAKPIPNKPRWSFCISKAIRPNIYRKSKQLKWGRLQLRYFGPQGTYFGRWDTCVWRELWRGSSWGQPYKDMGCYCSWKVKEKTQKGHSPWTN